MIVTHIVTLCFIIFDPNEVKFTKMDTITNVKTPRRSDVRRNLLTEFNEADSQECRTQLGDFYVNKPKTGSVGDVT